MALSQPASLPQLALTSRLEQLNWTASGLNYRYGTLLVRNVFGLSQLLTIEEPWGFCLFMMSRMSHLLTVGDVGQGHASLYPSFSSGHHSWSSSAGPVTVSWNLREANPTENGYSSTSGYYYDPQKDISVSGSTQSGANSASQQLNSSSQATTATQDYSSYIPYSSSTVPYGYSNAEYQNYYYNYQQPSNDSSSQQVGANQNPGAAYQPLSSFQNSGSYVGPTSYLGTYYNAGDHQTVQTTTGYENSSYYYQNNSWNDRSYSANPSHPHLGYPSSDTTSIQSSTTISANPSYYQQQYNQWPSYYNQSVPSSGCTPGTEHQSTSVTSAAACPAVGVSCGYSYMSSQPPPPGTTSWRKDAGTSALSSLQEKSHTAAHPPTVNQVVGDPWYQNHLPSQVPSYSQKPAILSPLPANNHEDQQRFTYPRAPILNVPSSIQVQQPLHTTTMSDTQRVSKIQIPTNPRIASGLSFGIVKSDKENLVADTTPKPAYISVSVPKNNTKASAPEDNDAIIKGTMPVSLRAYVERTFVRCKNDAQRTVNQSIMKEMINKASADGTLFTRNWDIEPLFPLPNTPLDANEQNILSNPAPVTLPKFKRSPSRRLKSRWEPVAEEKLVEKPELVTNDSARDLSWGRLPATERPATNSRNFVKFLPSQQQTPLKFGQGPAKKPKIGDPTPTSVTRNGDASSDSDKEQGLTKYYASTTSLSNSPEEKRRREHRYKRFEKGQDDQAQTRHFRPKNDVTGSISSRRASAVLLAKSYEDGVSRAVEDIDWDALTVKGSCQEIEKRYLRLTSAPDPTTVRPEDVLEKALHMVQTSQKNYLYKCDQLKSIRQDLTVQRIQNELTVKVYETHARLALQAGDLPEYNQCQSQLKRLYGEGIKGCHMEFSAYNLLCINLHSNNKRDLLSSMTRLSVEAKADEAVKHALAVHSAVSSGNYVLFFRLYKTAPNLNTCLMDLYAEKMRFEAVKCMAKSYRPTVPVRYIAWVLGFSRTVLGGDGDFNDTDKLEECEEWLRAHGAVLIADNNGMQMDAKASASTLFMPEPEDAVAHGDTTLAVDDFLTRAS
ncbi:SAC3 family protein A-like isoform X2 [Typha angustifolia]|uniref:SAC3 family protein A-like isoform X2 n=1 Tax=Typha angustifolia TaxID=59011 RepID=UPI003C2DFC50